MQLDNIAFLLILIFFCNIVNSQDIDSPRGQRQGDSDVDVSFPAVAAATAGSDGKRCIDKVEMVEETQYDEVVQCDHSYDRRYTFLALNSHVYSKVF